MNMILRERVLAAFHRRFGTYPEAVAHAPGRVNLLGEHLDYNEGFVLPVAIDKETLVAFRRSGSNSSTLLALDLDEEISFDDRSVLEKRGTKGDSLPHWAFYPAGVMWSLNSSGLGTPGMQAVFASDVPRGAGLSSSASVEMAFGIAWKNLAGWSIAPMQLAKIALKAEVDYVGLNCGIMDQFASACSMKNRVLILDCRSLDWRTAPLPDGTALVISDTSIRRSLTSSAYNDRHSACEDAVRFLQQSLPGIHSLRDVSVDQFHEFVTLLPPIVAKRAQHVVEEIARTEQAIKFLNANDPSHFGELMNTCHASLRDLYEVSSPELDTMVSVAQSLPGCYGARLTGAGFGGCTINMVRKDTADGFARDLEIGYAKITRLHPEIYTCSASDGAGVE